VRELSRRLSWSKESWPGGPGFDFTRKGGLDRLKTHGVMECWSNGILNTADQKPMMVNFYFPPSAIDTKNKTTKKAPFPILGNGAFFIKHAQHKTINPPHLQSNNLLLFSKRNLQSRPACFSGRIN
jgi:hypothetical protein